MSMLILAAFGSLSFVVADEPQGTSRSAQTETQAPAADPNRRICRTPAATGSILTPRRECHTRAEWAEIQERNNADARNAIANRQSTLRPGE